MRKSILLLLTAILLPLNLMGASYIKEVAVSGNSDKNAARNFLLNEGYTVIGTDLNQDAGGWYIFLGYKTTDKYDEAITNLMVMRGSYSTAYGADRTVNVTDGGKNWEYHPVDRYNTEFNGDLNKKAGGEDLFLYYTRSNITDGQVISGLSVVAYGSGKSDANFVKGCDDQKRIVSNMDCNADAGGDYVYIRKSMSSYNATSAQLDGEFRVVHHGGRLYQFLIPVGVAQTDKPTLTMGNDSDNAVVRANWTNGTSTQLFYLHDLNSNGLDFSSDWQVKLGQNQGLFLDESHFGLISNNSVIGSSMGNHRDRKLVSVLWLAPDDWEVADISSFQIVCDKAHSVSSTFQVDKTVSQEASFTLAEGMNQVTVIDPFVDYDNNMPGWQSSFVSAVQKFYSLGIWDGSQNKFVFKEDYSSTSGLQEKYFNISSVDYERELVAMLYSQYVSTLADGSMDTTMALISVPFTSLAVHRIVDSRNGIWVSHTDTATGIANPTPVIQWAIESPKDDDLFSGDQFLVTRSGTDDFVNASVVASYNLEDTAFTEIRDGKQYGWYRIEDILDKKAYQAVTDPDSVMYLLPDAPKYTSYPQLLEYTIPNRKMYYHISRVIIDGVWPDPGDSIGFTRTIEVPLTATLPSVSRVNVRKLAGWDTQHKVEVTVRLDNPYFWDIVPADRKESLKHMLQSDGIDYRMFVWDVNAGIQVERYSPEADHWIDNGKVTDYAAKTFSFKGKDVKWTDEDGGYYYLTFTDFQTAPYTSFYYRAKVDVSEALLSTCHDRNDYVCNADSEAYRLDGMAFISGQEASVGTYPGLVYGSWDITDGMNDGFRLFRRSNGENWTELKLDGPKATSYKDNDVEPGTVYEYRIVADVTYKGVNYQDSVSVFGTPSYYGSISGKVRLSDGSGMPARLSIRIRRVADNSGSTALNIPDMYYTDSEGRPALLMKGYSDTGFERVVPINADGTFYLDSIPHYTASGTRYQLDVMNTDIRFENPAGVNGAYTVTMDADNCNITKVDFTCNDMRRISGHVMFNGSTVPSRYVHFRVNGVPVTDANGQLVETDQNGAFSFYVPKTQVSIQAYRDGHVFKGEGYVLGGDKADQKEFTPLQDYDGIRIWDDTKVRLVGRMAGGDHQAVLPQGLGYGTNNLGDELLMVLQLEGDESSQIVFDQNNPDNTQRDTVFCQSILLDGEAETVDSTMVSFQKKRIVIQPDVKTGEFCLDLFPTKYKVVQLSAKGYSTLFSAGEGFEVIDLTNDTIMLSVCDTVQVGRIREIRSGQYQACYQKIYHNEATVTYTQTDIVGNDLSYLGETKVTEASLAGYDMNAPLSWADPESGKQQYLFGYPVFQQGNKYFFKVSAHEDYYYNGDRTRQPDVVYLDKGSLTVYNGLESSTSTVKAELNANGSATVVLKVNNPTFVYTGEAALRKVNMQVNVNGYYYHSDTLKAYVLGMKQEGNDFATLGDNIDVIDIVRDPYGATSYAYREAGTKYYWNHNSNKTTTWAFHINLSMGGGSTNYIGLGMATKSEWSVMGNGSLNIPIANISHNEVGEYTMTLNERISTSSAAFDEGACADVYIGAITALKLGKSRAFAVIDSTSYRYLKKAIDNRTVQVVSQGTDKSGTPYYLVIGQKLLVGDTIKSTFAYSQKYILGTLIPTMLDELDELVMDCSAQEAQQLANTKGEPQYYYEMRLDNGDRDTTWTIEMATPEDDDTPYVNEAQELINSINAWRRLIAVNEKQKLDLMNNGEVFRHYSVANTSINYTESASTYYTSRSSSKTFSDDDFNGSISGSIGAGAGGKNYGAEGVDAKSNGEITAKEFDGDNNLVYEERRPKSTESKVSIPGFIVNGSFNLSPATSWNNTYSNYRTSSAGAGFVLAMADNSYMDIDVYRYVDKEVMGQKEWDFITSVDKHADDNKETVSEGEFVFVARGGARRNPWLAPDSTMVLVDNTTGRGFPLSEQVLKIDNPRIYIDQPVVSNVPKGERAVFTVRLANETEISKDVKYFAPSSFKLKLEDKSNPRGVKVYMDGMPLTDGRTIPVAPGTSVTKTFEVERGMGYDFENIRLKMSDGSASLNDYAAFSVHFLPESTPVRLVQPTNGWVINTLSPLDSLGYYLPVEISGFDINYENFDHIELQYKKSTEGESQWVNVCSYYANDSLYQAATGNKARIVSGSIKNVRFYGATDPVEIGYDLRAVSFCRLGTGFVSKASEVMSGQKDTRRPQVFGLPKPADGILSFDDVISLPFNEDVAFNNLNAVANFQIQGYTNNSDVDHKVSVYFEDMDIDESGNNFTYSNATYAATSVERNLSDRDFSIDMMARIGNREKTAMLYLQEKVIGEEDGAFYFGYAPLSDCLFAFFDNARFVSDCLSENGLSVRNAMTHLGMTYHASDSTVQFFVGDRILGSHGLDGKDKAVCRASGKVVLGYGLIGNMTDVRLWGKTLSAYEIGNKYGIRLSDNETGLIAYWPLDEGNGLLAADRAGGADLTFHGCTWETPDGYSLKLDGKPIRLNDIRHFQRDAAADYSLSFWFRASHLDSDSVALFRAGSDALTEEGFGKLWIGFKDRLLVCRTNGIDYSMGEKLYNDNQWHKFTLTVDRSRNVASMYVDHSLRNELKASLVDGVVDDRILLGDEGFTGNIDELSFWHIALPSPYLETLYNTALMGNEMELQVYLPFEMDRQNDQATMYTDFSPYNMTQTSAGTYDLSNPMIDLESVTEDGEQHAPIRTNTGLQNFQFDWVCTDNELLIDIHKDDKDINHQQIFLTVRGVEDLAGNSMTQPQMWSVYVDRNVLKWNDTYLNVETIYGQDTTLVAHWQNTGGRTVNYTISENCSWLSLSETMGTIMPLGQTQVEMEISDGLAPGKYSTTLYLTDDKGLISPMTLNLTVSAIPPVWVPTSDKSYNQSMLLVGQVVVKDSYGEESIDMDKRDLVGVFCDGVCVGVSNIVAPGTTGKGEDSNLYLNILGTAKMNPSGKKPGQLLEFRLWDANRGTISILNPDTIRFASNKAVGVVPDKPVRFTISDYKVQEISLQEGWNWVSFNVAPTQDYGLNMLFMDNEAFSDGDVFQHIGNPSFGVYDENDKWVGDAESIDISYTNVYLMYMHRPGIIKVKGRSLDTNSRVVHIRHSNRWNELPYLLDVAQPIQMALSDYPLPFQSAESKATEGDWVKSHDEFAIATSTGWVGSLQTLRPGVGYYLFHKGDSCDIKFTNNTRMVGNGTDVKNTGKVAMAEALMEASHEASEYASALPAVVALADETLYHEGDMIVAYANGREVGHAACTELEDRSQRFFLMIHASEGARVQFALVRDGQISAVTSPNLIYDGESILGSLNKPYQVDFTENDSQDDVYDLLGRRYQSLPDTRSVYIQGGKKVMK